MNRIYISSIILTISCFSVFSQKYPSDTIEKKRILVNPARIVEDFYKAYTASLLSDPHSSRLDMEKYLTKRLIEKTERVLAATGADPIIRAQDFNETAFETLKVEPLESNWYMVSYRWNMNDGGSNKSIPLKVALVNGNYMIDYITPEWNGPLYGDTLLCKDIPQHTVDNSNPQSMLETFFAAYTCLYGNMPEGLASQLKTLRDKHLTPKAKDLFEEAVNKHKSDGLLNYDLLIDNFDFDCLWISSMTYTALTENSFQVSYTQGISVKVIVVTLIAFDGRYKIDTIRINKQV
ncbi:MAG: DUF3828 domain-containing protein [Petrimonas sp.]|nr:DUF3828 domain-containing protein [Petrimonas sp.]HMM18531.1 DUF3828 domain-containing protein [Petrimonas sp.]